MKQKTFLEKYLLQGIDKIEELYECSTHIFNGVYIGDIIICFVQFKNIELLEKNWKSCIFRPKPATYSGINLPVIPVESCHLFRLKTATRQNAGNQFYY